MQHIKKNFCKKLIICAFYLIGQTEIFSAQMMVQRRTITLSNKYIFGMIGLGLLAAGGTLLKYKKKAESDAKKRALEFIKKEHERIEKKLIKIKKTKDQKLKQINQQICDLQKEEAIHRLPSSELSQELRRYKEQKKDFVCPFQDEESDEFSAISERYKSFLEYSSNYKKFVKPNMELFCDALELFQKEKDTLELEKDEQYPVDDPNCILNESSPFFHSESRNSIKIYELIEKDPLDISIHPSFTNTFGIRNLYYKTNWNLPPYEYYYYPECLITTSFGVLTALKRPFPKGSPERLLEGFLHVIREKPEQTRAFLKPFLDSLRDSKKLLLLNVKPFGAFESDVSLGVIKITQQDDGKEYYIGKNQAGKLITFLIRFFAKNQIINDFILEHNSSLKAYSVVWLAKNKIDIPKDEISEEVCLLLVKLKQQLNFAF